jgi:hypothetical protein
VHIKVLQRRFDRISNDLAEGRGCRGTQGVR